MEAAAKTKDFSGTDYSSPPRKSISSPHSLNLPFNGFKTPELQIPDIEMATATVTGHFVEYTSLKDLLPSSSSSPAIMSPTPTSSWHEIPIKNPLVKHAAMAYLQPMSIRPEIESKGLLGKLKEKCLCGGAWGCFEGLGDVFLETVREALGVQNDEVEEDEMETMRKFTES
ncbi:uncharacterized protein LOC133787698 [Humulus lupulus]|uniref:uncharacterized protein LOC133787698 n=1 Tax=Humulus lupulus TaxID=3486 RepID=UPI002B400A4A|nr:uncharacterized protein LOC133787698 [Humulus lupulus]